MAEYMIIITVLSLSISLVNVLFVYMIYKLVIGRFSAYDQKFSELDIDSELQAAFSEHVENHEEFNHVINELFHKVKKKYNLKDATSYSELLDRIRNNTEIEEKLRQNLSQFFEKIIVFSYKTDDISDIEKSDLRKEIKMILKKFQEDD